MLRYIALTIFTFLCAPVHSLELYEWTLDINTSSRHQERTYGNNKFYNENNNGFGFTYGYTDAIDVKIGYFTNSYHKTSLYGGIILNKDFYAYGDFVISPGLGVMFSSGYDNTPIESPLIAPIIHPSISIGFRTMRSTIGIIPAEKPVITFQTQIQF